MRYYSNTAAEATLLVGVTSGETALSVDTVAGFPVQFPFTVVIDPDSASAEVVTVTNVVGTVLTVTRAEDGTAAVTHSTGASVIHSHSARDWADSREHEDATFGVHGLTGTVVGTSDSQVLTNKNLASGTNTFPSSLATLTGAQTLTNKDLTASSNVYPETVKRLAGEIVAYGGSSAPTGWLLCDGSAVSRSTYATLFTAIGATYGAGDGSTTFNLPDLRSRFPVGAGTYASLGADEGDAEASRTPSHTHNAGTLATASDGSHNHSAGTLTTSNYTMNDTQNTTTGGTAGRLNGDAHNITHNHNVSGSTSSDGAHTHNISGATAATDPIPYVSVNYLIKT